MASNGNSATDPQAVCRAIAIALVETGRLLVTGGMLFGGDRVAQRTKWGYGDERTVGLAVATEVAGDLASSAVDLLDSEHAYSAAALLRQIVEVEYLVWLFTHDEEEARRWLNADDDELRRIFGPSDVHRRSGGFGTGGYGEYKAHCGLGGHPSPKSRHLLPNHSSAIPAEWLWNDLSHHLTRLWRSLGDAVTKLGFPAQLPEDAVSSVDAVLAHPA